MYKGNPVLTVVLLGLPLGLFSIICYTTCCTDILEAADEDEETEVPMGTKFLIFWHFETEIVLNFIFR